MNDNKLEEYWTNRYLENKTGWNIGYPSPPLCNYFDQLINKDLKILIPGAGNAYEAEYLFKNGFRNVAVLDISEMPLNSLRERVPDFPNQNLIKEDFFLHQGEYDLILEQTFFCSFEPTNENREQYALKMHSLLTPKGKLVGLWFNHPLFEGAKRPFGGTKAEYLNYFSPNFNVKAFEECYNSIESRKGKELFGIFLKKIK